MAWLVTGGGALSDLDDTHDVAGPDLALSASQGSKKILVGMEIEGNQGV